MKNFITALALGAATAAHAQIVDGVVLNTSITPAQLVGATQNNLTHDLDSLPPVLVGGALALLDPDYLDTPMGMSPLVRQLGKSLFLSVEGSLERDAQELAIARAYDEVSTHDTVLAAYLERAYLGQNCYGMGWTSVHGFGHPPSEMTLPEVSMLLTLLAAQAYNPYRPDTQAIVQTRLTDLQDDPQLMADTNRRVLDHLRAVGLITQSERDDAAAAGIPQRQSCPVTADTSRHPNDLSDSERIRVALRAFRTDLPPFILIYDALLANLGMTFEDAFAPENPMARAVATAIWPKDPTFQALAPDFDAFVLGWREIWGSPFDLAPVYMELQPLGLGCTGPSELNSANWNAEIESISYNQQAVLAALMVASDPDALIADPVALLTARNHLLEGQIALDRGDTAPLIEAISQPLPPLDTRCE